MAQGYRLGKDNKVVKSGLLLVENAPEPGIIYINGVERDNAAPGRFVLDAGSYEVSLEREGYHGWKKQVNIPALGVRNLRYPIMIPKELKTQPIAALPKLGESSQSPDRQLLIAQVAGEPLVESIKLDPKKPEVSTISLPGAFKRENNSVGTISVIRWSNNSKKFLAKQTLPSGKVDILSVDMTKLEDSINLTDFIGPDVAPEDVFFTNDRGDHVYVLNAGRLMVYNLDTKSATVLLDRVKAYRAYSDNVIAFSRISNDGLSIESGLLDGDRITIVHKMAASEAKPLLSYGEFNEAAYFAVGLTGSETLTIYKNPLRKPILPTQLPLVTLTGPKLTTLDLSASGQFLLAQGGRSILVFDFDESLKYQFEAAGDLASAKKAQWVNGEYMTLSLADGRVSFGEYDGQNQQVIASVRSVDDLYFSPNLRYSYSLSDGVNGTSLQTTSLIYSKE